MALGKTQITRKGRTNVYTVPSNMKATVNVSVHGIQTCTTRLAVTTQADTGFDSATMFSNYSALVDAANPNYPTQAAALQPVGTQAFFEQSGAITSSDAYGRAVTMSRDGQWAAVGVPQDDDSVSTDSGSVEIFRLVNGTWTFHQVINQTDGTSSTSSHVGSTVCMNADGSYLVVLQSGVGSRFHIYFRATAAGQYSLQQTFTVDSVIDPNSTFNQNMSITDLGDRIAFGSWTDTGGTGGRVRIYTRSGTTWTNVQTINNPSAAATDQFGCSVSLSGDGTYLAIGEQGDDDTQGGSGKAHVYLLSGATYTAQQVFKAPTPQINGAYGGSVAMSRDGLTLAVGETGRTVAGLSSAGQVYVYTRSGTTWTLQATLNSLAAQTNEQFGYRVVLGGGAGNLLLVSAPNFNTQQGAVYQFTRAGTTWSTATRITSKSPQNNANFGFAICATPALPSAGDTFNFPLFDGEFFDAPQVTVGIVDDYAFIVGEPTGQNGQGRVEFTRFNLFSTTEALVAVFRPNYSVFSQEETAQLDKRNSDLIDRFTAEPLKTFERTGLVLDSGESVIVVTDTTTNLVVQVRGFEKEV